MRYTKQMVGRLLDILRRVLFPTQERAAPLPSCYTPYEILARLTALETELTALRNTLANTTQKKQPTPPPQQRTPALRTGAAWERNVDWDLVEGPPKEGE